MNIPQLTRVGVTSTTLSFFLSPLNTLIVAMGGLESTTFVTNIVNLY